MEYIYIYISRNKKGLNSYHDFTMRFFKDLFLFVFDDCINLQHDPPQRRITVIAFPVQRTPTDEPSLP